MFSRRLIRRSARRRSQSFCRMSCISRGQRGPPRAHVPRRPRRLDLEEDIRGGVGEARGIEARVHLADWPSPRSRSLGPPAPRRLTWSVRGAVPGRRRRAVAGGRRIARPGRGRWRLRMIGRRSETAEDQDLHQADAAERPPPMPPKSMLPMSPPTSSAAQHAAPSAALRLDAEAGTARGARPAGSATSGSATVARAPSSCASRGCRSSRRPRRGPKRRRPRAALTGREPRP